MSRALTIALAAALLWLGAAAPSLAGTAKAYAYLSVQGKLTEAGDGRAIVGATVTLRSSGERFRSVTDSRGVFVFEKLPLAEYTIEVRSGNGETIRNVRRFDTPTPELTMLQLNVGRGAPGARAPEPIVIDAAEDPIVVVVPDPRTRWNKLWKESLVFVALGTAIALGL